MTSQETMRCLARNLRLRRLVRAALLVLAFGQLLTGRLEPCDRDDRRKATKSKQPLLLKQKLQAKGQHENQRKTG